MAVFLVLSLNLVKIWQVHSLHTYNFLTKKLQGSRELLAAPKAMVNIQKEALCLWTHLEETEEL